jgi:hypothetical protein
MVLICCFAVMMSCHQVLLRMAALRLARARMNALIITSEARWQKEKAANSSLPLCTRIVSACSRWKEPWKPASSVVRGFKVRPSTQLGQAWGKHARKTHQTQRDFGGLPCHDMTQASCCNATIGMGGMEQMCPVWRVLCLAALT